MTRVLALLLVVGVAAPAAAENASLARCQEADQEFDYEKVLAECAVAVAEPNTSQDEKVLIFQLLGIAHTALGDAKKAEIWFTRLLVLSPNHELGDDVSPVYREAFALAKERFFDEGKVTVEHTPPAMPGADEPARAAPYPVEFKVSDKLGRVSDARVTVRAVVGQKRGDPLEVALTRTDGEAPGQFILRGELPDPIASGQRPSSYALEYKLVLKNAVGVEIEPEPAIEPTALPIYAPEAEPVSGGGSGLLYGGIGAVAVGAGVVVLAGAAAGTAVAVCAFTSVCSPEAPSPQIAFVNVSVAE